ncbi:Dehydrodolichyl diphosphate synthase complex subunit nus1 [Erysiphe neolycopersici]|uniref:ditrans,polycis-polyprenyl diphosphate synthase [(2E,6E)-farnesyldiphosphate specific] n=1 Tax=Erysiphe neolycopersici TaxID=212602 RepID=A0A420HD24_9PEZI|nr:Dehydrodolichyl diphosphate synthase complex subunit nus1 [Erysiphe neolycopersici]
MEAYRRDAKVNHSLYSKEEREELLAPYLPVPRVRSRSSHDSNNPILIDHNDHKYLRPSLRAKRFIQAQIHALCYLILQTLFSVYLRIRFARNYITTRILAILYYHHRASELIQRDVRALHRLPKHLSVVLNINDAISKSAALEELLDKVAELSVWCACVGIPTLSVYERTGILKSYISTTHKAIGKKLSSYLGAQQPALSVRAPHLTPLISPATSNKKQVSKSPLKKFQVLLLSFEDGRDSLVDLTKTLVEMAQHSKLSPIDISTDLIDTEISESVMGDPDLLVLFTPSIELQGYPPWQLRLTEIFHVQDNLSFGYHVFLQALYNYANAQMRFGR